MSLMPPTIRCAHWFDRNACPACQESDMKLAEAHSFMEKSRNDYIAKLQLENIRLKEQQKRFLSDLLDFNERYWQKEVSKYTAHVLMTMLNEHLELVEGFQERTKDIIDYEGKQKDAKDE